MAGYEEEIQAFVQEAVRVLDQVGRDIGDLSEWALGAYNRISSQPGIDSDDRVEHLLQVARQFEKLAERGQSLKGYLADGMELPPEDDDVWPRMRIIQSQEEERSRLARELEDSVGQLLANSVFELASCRYLLETEGAALDEGLASLQTELEQGLTQVRDLIADLDPPSIIGNFGLVAGLRRYMERYESRTGLESTVQVRAITERLPATVEVAIFRIIQEALENVWRHAEASRVDVSIYEEDGNLIFSVTDDGVGLQPTRIGSRGRSLGLVHMYDRAELLQGKLRVRSEVEKGTQLILSVPYPIS